MEIYPALRAQMGNWVYYVVRMTAKELDSTVKFAYDFYEDRTLDEAMQRVLDESRVKREIVEYLTHQSGRFFSALVVAAVEGNPQFWPIEIAQDPRFEMFKGNKRLSEAFGVLTFDGDQRYYALDGQHRLKAIKTLLDKDDPISAEAPAGFSNDEFSVLIVVPQEDDTNETFRQKYRRLFSNLNRYARPMAHADNIIMDEDDLFAILTRRLITDHDFFRFEGRAKQSTRVWTGKGKNVRSEWPQFTTLEQLYGLNAKLLTSEHRSNEGWGDNPTSNKSLIGIRPSDDVLDELFDELVVCWDAILEEIPDLKKAPQAMRDHNADPRIKDWETSDHLLFWPIGQQLLADFVRGRMRMRPEGSQMTLKFALARVAGLGQVDWRLHKPPWRNLLLVWDEEKESWRMRSEDRKSATDLAGRILDWMLGDVERGPDEIEDLKRKWHALLIPAIPKDEADTMWEEVVEESLQIGGGRR